MDFSSPVADTTALFIQEIGALLFGMVFLFLWRQSRVVYFGLWSVAWRCALSPHFRLRAAESGNVNWLAPYAVFEFGFVIVLVAAARAGFGSDIKDWRTVLRLIAILPIFVALVYALGFLSRLEAYHASHAVVLCFVYFYNFATLRRNEGMGGAVFRFSLLLLAAAFLEHAIIFLYLYNAGNAPEWARYLHHELTTISRCTACSRFPPWRCGAKPRSTASANCSRTSTSVRGKANTIRSRPAHRPAKSGGLGAAHRGGRRVSRRGGSVRHGQLQGSQRPLRPFGGRRDFAQYRQLVQASIRHEDEAFRWGGDEFVILFHNQFPEVAAKRMAELELRLHEFRVRGFGTLPISVSWGTANARGRALRDALDEADRNMYVVKRSRAAETARQSRQGV